MRVESTNDKVDRGESLLQYSTGRLIADQGVECPFGVLLDNLNQRVAANVTAGTGTIEQS